MESVYSALPSIFIDDIYKRSLCKWAQPLGIKQVEFVASQLSGNAGLIGASFLAIKKHLYSNLTGHLIFFSLIKDMSKVTAKNLVFTAAYIGVCASLAIRWSPWAQALPSLTHQTRFGQSSNPPHW